MAEEKMYTLEQLVSMKRIPQWIADGLSDTCEDGYKILTNWALTRRLCSNPKCYHHMKWKGDAMFKLLDIKNIGPETCYKTLRNRKMNNHVELLPLYLDYKPYKYIWEIANIASIHGWGESKLMDLMYGYSSFKEYFETAVGVPEDLRDWRGYLEYCEKYFDVRPSFKGKVIQVTIHDSIKGYRRKELFIDKCNEILQGMLTVKYVKHSNSKNRFLITMFPNHTNEKVLYAKDPRTKTELISPQGFIKFLTKEVNTL